MATVAERIDDVPPGTEARECKCGGYCRRAEPQACERAVADCSCCVAVFECRLCKSRYVARVIDWCF